MGAKKHEQQLRLQLREYKLMLGQFSEGSMNDEGELNSRMGNLLAMQLQRHETFDIRMACEPSERDFLAVDNASLVGKLRVLRSDLSGIPAFDSQPRYEAPFHEERRFCEYAIGRIEEELKSRGVSLEKPSDPVEAVTALIHHQVEVEARLRRQCEEDVQKYSDQEESIRRSYRRAIDALREQH
jgi:hypothetical protein